MAVDRGAPGMPLAQRQAEGLAQVLTGQRAKEVKRVTVHYSDGTQESFKMLTREERRARRLAHNAEMRERRQAALAKLEEEIDNAER